jgi:pimeloyl-ACP methyl ester carboxylesterase
VDDARLRVCLERTVELGTVRLRLRDWPGHSSPVIHVPDPVSPRAELVDALATALAPGLRVLSLQPRGDAPYQVDAADLLAVLDQFGFVRPVLIGERLGCLPALLIAAWHPGRLGRLVLIDPTCDPKGSAGIAASALRDCPPDWRGLRNAVDCPVHEVAWSSTAVDDIARMVTSD